LQILDFRLQQAVGSEQQAEVAHYVSRQDEQGGQDKQDRETQSTKGAPVEFLRIPRGGRKGTKLRRPYREQELAPTSFVTDLWEQPPGGGECRYPLFIIRYPGGVLFVISYSLSGGPLPVEGLSSRDLKT
jgi:hypothetical protein